MNHKRGDTYTKVLDLVKDVVVKSEVVAGDDIDTSILLDLPVSKTEALGLSKKVRLRDLSTPVYIFLLVDDDTSQWKCVGD
jgi:hypothetical protein